MKSLPTEWLTEIDKRGGIRPRLFFRFVARNRDTNADEVLGIWTGGDVQNFTIEGVNDTFYGAGTIMSVGRLKSELGTNIRKLTISVAHLTPEIMTLIRQYDVKGAKVKVWSALFGTTTEGVIGTPIRRFKGYVDKAPIYTAEKGGVSSTTLDLVSSARNLGRRVPSKYSDDNQKIRNPNDTMLQYIGVTGLIQVPWGTKTVSSNGGSTVSPSIGRLGPFIRSGGMR